MTKKRQVYIIILIIFYIFLYAFRIFQLSQIHILVNILKIAIPLLLYMLTPFNTDLKIVGRIKSFISVFMAFSFLALISTLFSAHIYETFLQYLKIFPTRILFIIALSNILFRYPELIYRINRILFLIGVFVFIQYLFFTILNQFIQLSIHSLPVVPGFNVSFVGPFGLLGILGASYFVDFVHITRLVGYWFEPSNASGFLYSAFFLGLFIKKSGTSKIKSIFFLFPLLGGFFTLSNAGYASFIAGLMVYLFAFSKNKASSFLKVAVLFMFLITAFLGRYLVAEMFPDNEYLKIMTGVKRVSARKNIDYSAGRIGRYEDSFQYAIDHPFGSGYRLAGEKGDEDASASAIFYTLKSSGFLGLFLMIMLQIIVLRPVFSFHYRKYGVYPQFVFTSSAFVVVLVQNIIYGTWLSPYYYYLAITTVISFQKWNSYGKSQSFYQYLFSKHLIAK